MPDSLVAQLVSSVWDDLTSAVNEGLALKTPLADVIPVVAKNLASTTWPSPLVDADPGRGESLVRGSASPVMAFDCLHRYHLDHDTLRSPHLDDLKAWAAAVRKFELTYVVKHLAAAAAPHPCTADGESLEACRRSAPGLGPAQMRNLHTRPGRDPGPRQPPVRGLGRPDQGRHAVRGPRRRPGSGFRLGGGPYIKRPADLALGWVCAADGSMDRLLSVDLVLAEQLELVNATVDTVAAIKMVAA